MTGIALLMANGVVENDERTLLKRDGTPVYASITASVVYGLGVRPGQQAKEKLFELRAGVRTKYDKAYMPRQYHLPWREYKFRIRIPL